MPFRIDLELLITLGIVLGALMEIARGWINRLDRIEADNDGTGRKP